MRPPMIDAHDRKRRRHGLEKGLPVIPVSLISVRVYGFGVRGFIEVEVITVTRRTQPRFVRRLRTGEISAKHCAPCHGIKL